MEAFVLKTLRKLRKESPRRFKDLRAVCDELIAALTEKETANGGESQETDADQYFEPLEMACETRQPRLMEIALDALHFLIEHGYLRGRKKITLNDVEPNNNDEEGKPPQVITLMDVIVEAVSKCSDETDDGVQLQVIKALLTAITSLHCEVHEASLLLAVRACFHIHLISRNSINKTTAKAALTQMLSVVTQRMELHDTRDGALLTPTELAGTPDDPAYISASHCGVPVAGTDTASPNSSARNHVQEKLVGSASRAHADPDSGTTAQSEEEGGGTSNGAVVPGSSLVFPSIYHKDAYLLFRALCKLSMKGLSEDTSQWSQSDAIPLQNKILSLELILSIIRNSGPAFRNGDKFIYAVRTYLCVSLLSNCTSHVAQVTGLSLQIFSVLLQLFKEHLKNELEVFVSTIFLRMLESENSTYDHKARVLEVFQSICRDPKAQVELFMNYDCDLDAINLFSRMVAGFAKIAKNPSLLFASARGGGVSVDFISSASKKAQQEEQQIRAMGLEGLVIIVNSLTVSAGLINNTNPGGSGTHPANTTELSTSNAIDDDDDGGDDAGTSPVKRVNSGTYSSVSSSHDKLSSLSTAEDNVHSNVDLNTNGNIVDVFDKKQRFQEELDTGILKFNLAPKKGLEYLAKLGHLDLTPKCVATFMRQYQDRLDKTAMGEYLGREREYQDGFCLKVLHEYVEALDFADMPFDLAIRHFLSGFRLPGEAQKIDRIMEKFAERYYLQNREEFASADMAFILAFSTIMLQTNLHNPAIREDKRMTKEQFIKQNKGISADGELSDTLLCEIYDRISAEPISISNHEDKNARKQKKDDTQSGSFVMFQSSNDRRKKDAFSHERKEMVRAGEALIKHNMKRGSVAVFVRNSPEMSDSAYVRPMFDIVWPHMLGVLSQILDTYDEPQMIDMCLTGFQQCIMLACRLDFPTARHTLINALLKFTTLDSVREMRPKHVQCIKALMSTALSEGDFLEESWGQVLQTTSQLARLQLFANGSHTDDMFFGEDASTSSANSDGSRMMFRRGSSMQSGSSDAFTKLFFGPSRAESNRLVEENNAELVMRDIDPVVVDRLYLNSIHLSADSVKHFVKCLCQVSLLEISTTSTMNSLRGKDSTGDASAPRIFSLQKLVEVADCNMFSRARVDWSNIWSLLARHFSLVGLHENQAVSMYAIDSLKQLSIKFLQKEELSNFNFQRVFLKPFETIIAKTRSFEIKDLILTCIEVMIRACAGNIHSGWRTIFAIFSVAAAQEMPGIATSAFAITENLMDEQFGLLIFDFVELMNCLVAFAASQHTALALKSLVYLTRCADHLAQGTVSPAIDAQHTASDNRGLSWDKAAFNVSSTGDTPTSLTGVSEDDSVFRLWWPLLLGLSTSVADSRLKVRVKALDSLNLVLRSHGYLFSPQTWSVIFKGVLFPIIDSAQMDNTEQPRSSWPTDSPTQSQDMSSWIGTMGFFVLTSFVEIYQLFGEEDRTIHIFPELLALLENCVSQQDTESLARMALTVMDNLLLSGNNSPGGEVNDSSVPRQQKHQDLICKRIARDVVKSLCIDFGDAGNVSFSSGEGRNQIPDTVRSLVPVCPLAARRISTQVSFRGVLPLDEEDSDENSGGLRRSIGRNKVAVKTPYGNGHLLEQVTVAQSHLQLPPRLKISLAWGGFLYGEESVCIGAGAGATAVKSLSALSTQSAKASEDENNNKLLASPPLSREESWMQLAGSAMTSMVVSLKLIVLISELLRSQLYSWRLEHYSTFLNALECSHWHAFKFNENIPLRLQLHQRGFMSTSTSGGAPSPSSLPVVMPHLLEQEILSMEQLLFTVFRLYCHSKHSQPGATAPSPSLCGGSHALSDLECESFAEPRIERLSTLVITRYLAMEETALRRNPRTSAATNNIEDDCDYSSSDEDDDDDYAEGVSDQHDGNGHSSVVHMKEFSKHRHDAYKSPVLIVLEGMMDFSHEQFQRNLTWIVPLLSRLVICEDLEVRICVRQIYQSFVNFLLIK